MAALPIPLPVIIILPAAAIALAVVLMHRFIRRRRQFPRLPDPDNLSQSDAESGPAELVRSYFRGLSYVLSNETDRAIAEFTRAAAISSATSEIYLALGQLFRSSGEVERAIRIHQSILLRSRLPDDIRLQTQFEIGLDYLRAGLLDRARQAFEALVDVAPTYAEALETLGSIYERTREWEKAIAIHKRAAVLRGGDHNELLLAHLTAEMAKEAEEQGNTGRAAALYQRALEIEHRCMDAWLHLGDLHLRAGRQAAAIEAWNRAFTTNPDLVTLVEERFGNLPEEAQPVARRDFYARHRERYGENRYFMAAYIAFLAAGDRQPEAVELARELLARHPDWPGMFNLLGVLVAGSEAHAERRVIYPVVADFFAAFRLPVKAFFCHHCGYELDTVVWKCPRCGHWDTIGPR
ncbi:MAG: tetratricopeptide repeat protein [Deltaproteobacteria bacterium]|nr:tetratricopeptide repeat protein [Candidatus Anaeroferrophillacea bacterium]